MPGLFNKVSHPLNVRQALDFIAADTNELSIYLHISMHKNEVFPLRISSFIL